MILFSLGRLSLLLLLLFIVFKSMLLVILSDVFLVNVMYEKGLDHGKAPNLSEWDRRMLGLLYGHLNPGDGGIEVGVAFARFWGK